MPFFPSLPEDAGVRKIWEMFNPKAHEGLTTFSRSFMRNEGKLTPAFATRSNLRGSPLRHDEPSDARSRSHRR